MKKMILLVIMSMCILTGCNSSDNNGIDDIIGKWQGSDIESSEFKDIIWTKLLMNLSGWDKRYK